MIPKGQEVRPGEATEAPPAPLQTCQAGNGASVDEEPVSVETLAQMKFAAPEGGPFEDHGSIEGRYQITRLEFALTQRLLPIFNSSDDELEQTIRADNDPERYMSLVDLCIAAKNRGEDAAEIYGAGVARLMVVLARLLDDVTDEIAEQAGGAS